MVSINHILLMKMPAKHPFLIYQPRFLAWETLTDCCLDAADWWIICNNELTSFHFWTKLSMPGRHSHTGNRTRAAWVKTRNPNH